MVTPVSGEKGDGDRGKISEKVRVGRGAEGGPEPPLLEDLQPGQVVKPRSSDEADTFISPLVPRRNLSLSFFSSPSRSFLLHFLRPISSRLASASFSAAPPGPDDTSRP